MGRCKCQHAVEPLWWSFAGIESVPPPYDNGFNVLFLAARFAHARFQRPANAGLMLAANKSFGRLATLTRDRHTDRIFAVLFGLVCTNKAFLLDARSSEQRVKRMRLAVLALSMLLPSAVLSGDLDAELSKEFAVYAMMASNAYLDSDRTYFPIESLGWVRVDLDGNPTPNNSYTPSLIGRLFSNLQYDIWVKSSENRAVIAFKGTDEKIDWIDGNFPLGISVPYKSAKKHVKRFVHDHPEWQLTLTGHSLGGGMALSVSLWEGVDAYVFNPSPRVFDGLGDHSEPATRKAVYQEGDILQKIRKWYPKFLKVMAAKDITQTHFDFNGDSNHKADLLAEGILRCAVGDPGLAEVASRIPKKVDCSF